MFINVYYTTLRKVNHTGVKFIMLRSVVQVHPSPPIKSISCDAYPIPTFIPERNKAYIDS